MTNNNEETSSPSNVVELPENINPEDFPELLEQTLVTFNNGDVIEGTIVRVDRNEVMVDVGYKSEGVIPSRELSVRKGINPREIVNEGEKIQALVLDKEDDEGRLILSVKRAVYEKAWGDIQEISDSNKSIKGTVIESVKGGLIVDIGVRGFLPASLIDVRRVKELTSYVGEEIEAKILELDRQRNNIVLSRKAHLEEEQSEERQGFLEDLEVGDIKEGKVSSIVNFGAFVDIGGMDGLVHVSELSWRHVENPNEIVKVGDKATVEDDENILAECVQRSKKGSDGLSVEKSSTSKQNIIVTLTCRDHDTHFEFAMRTNQTGSKHKLGQFIRLAFKYNGVVKKKR